MDNEEQPEELIEVEFTTRAEYIASAFNAIAATESLDVGLMTNTDATRVKRIRRKSLRIIDECINEMYAEFFDDNEED